MSRITTNQPENSSISWIRVHPSEWEVRPLTRCCDERKRRNKDNSETNVLSLSYGQIVRRDIESNFGLLPESFEGYNVVSPGDIVLRLTDLQNDKKSLRVGLVEERGIITSAYTTVVAGEELHPAFLYFLLHSYDIAKVFYSYGSGLRQSISFADLKKLPVLFPPLSTQKAIANFLDRKTTIIDKLIAKKERLIELLEEKRAALVNQAVTKGLNPDVPMKNSGIPWIGKIPEHWDTVKIRYLGRVTNGTTPSRKDFAAYWQNGDIPWVASGEINQYLIAEPTEYITRQALRECSLRLLPIGTVLVGMVGQGKTRGMSARLKISATTNQNLGAIEPSGLIDSAFLHLVLTTAYQTLRNHGQGGNQSALNCEVLGNFSLPLPPKEEQNTILLHLKEALCVIDQMANHIQIQSTKLQEYRQSLITTAVTGQIDVRERVNAPSFIQPKRHSCASRE